MEGEAQTFLLSCRDVGRNINTACIHATIFVDRYVARELAEGHPDEIAAVLPLMADAARLRHYEHHFSLLETLWKQLPSIAIALGKKRFKPHLELFLEPLHYSLESHNQLAQHAARGCVGALAKVSLP